MASPMIGIRIGRIEKKRLKEAAKLAGYTLSGFLRYAARTEAHRVLGDPKLVEQTSTSSLPSSTERKA